MSDTKSPSYPVFKAGLIQIALLFLFNPLFGVLDVIPDAIGFILLIIAVRMTCELASKMTEAGKYFIRCAIINVLQYVGYRLITLWSSGSTTPTLELILIFVTAIGGTVFAYLGFRAFFEGIGDLYAQGGEIPDFLLPVKGRFSRLDKFRHFTYVMLIVRAFFNILPELTALSPDETHVTSAWYQYILAFRAMLMIPPLIVGIVWLVKGLKLFGRIRKDRELQKGLDARFEKDVLPRSWPFIRDAYKGLTVCLLLASVCSVNLILAGKSYLPGFLAGLCALGAWFCFRRYIRIQLPDILICAGFTLGSVAAFAMRLVFAGKYEMDNLPYVLANDTSAWPAYVPVMLLSIAEYVLLAALWCRIWIALGKVIEEHTGPFKRMQKRDPELESRTEQAVHAELKRSLRYPVAAALLVGLVNAAYYILSTQWGYIWVAPIPAGLILIATTYTALSRIREGMERKYAFEDRDAGVETHAEID